VLSARRVPRRGLFRPVVVFSRGEFARAGGERVVRGVVGGGVELEAPDARAVEAPGERRPRASDDARWPDLLLVPAVQQDVPRAAEYPEALVECRAAQQVARPLLEAW